ncbi:MAG: hypothetical protein ABI811_13055 [Acidobacteriota bacterium]
MSAHQIVGWGAWAFLLVITAGWSVGCYAHAKREGGVTFATINTTIVWWVFLGWTFLSDIDKRHLLWLGPSALPVASAVTMWRATSMIGRNGRSMLPPGLFVLIVGYGLVLWSLS